jgi:hypothetical protein
MVIEHIVKGSKNTSLHNFILNINGMNINISNGSYFRAGKELFKSNNGATVTIPSLNELNHYEIWLTKDGISILTRTENEDFAFEQLVNQIDRISWFSVPPNCTNLNTIDIHFVKVVE